MNESYIDTLQNLPLPILVSFVLMAVGKVLKDKTPLNNDWIPPILGALGGIGFAFIEPSYQSVLIGILAGFGASGIHGAGKDLLFQKPKDNPPQ